MRPGVSRHAEKPFIFASFTAGRLLIPFEAEHSSVMRRPGPEPVSFEVGKMLGAGGESSSCYMTNAG